MTTLTVQAGLFVQLKSPVIDFGWLPEYPVSETLTQAENEYIDDRGDEKPG